MKAVLVTLMSTFSLFSFSQAHAFEHARHHGIYDCALSGAIRGASVAFVFGGAVISGPGVVACVNERSGRKTLIPVELRLIAGGVGFDLTFVNAIAVRSSVIRVAHPAALVRAFGLGASTGVRLLRAGLSFDTAVTATDDKGRQFEIGFTGKNILGFGARLYAMSFEVARR